VSRPGCGWRRHEVSAQFVDLLRLLLNNHFVELQELLVGVQTCLICAHSGVVHSWPRLNGSRSERSNRGPVGQHHQSVNRLKEMERPIRFEHARFLGDKRTQLVYDLDEWADPIIIDDIVAAGVGIQFGPDTLAEARNRGYNLAGPRSRRMQRRPRS